MSELIQLSLPPRTTQTPVVLSDAQRRVAWRLADALIPERGENPAASAAPNADAYLVTAFSARADVATQVLAYLDSVADDVDAWAEMKRLWHDDRELFDAFSTIAAGAYYMNTAVLAIVGNHLPHRAPAPEGQIVDELENGLLEPVIERGRIYVAPPDLKG